MTLHLQSSLAKEHKCLVEDQRAVVYAMNRMAAALERVLHRQNTVESVVENSDSLRLTINDIEAYNRKSAPRKKRGNKRGLGGGN